MRPPHALARQTVADVSRWRRPHRRGKGARPRLPPGGREGRVQARSRCRARVGCPGWGGRAGSRPPARCMVPLATSSLAHGACQPRDAPGLRRPIAATCSRTNLEPIPQLHCGLAGTASVARGLPQQPGLRPTRESNTLLVRVAQVACPTWCPYTRRLASHSWAAAWIRHRASQQFTAIGTFPGCARLPCPPVARAGLLTCLRNDGGNWPAGPLRRSVWECSRATCWEPVRRRKAQ